MLLPVAQAADTDVRKALTTLAQHKVIAEQVHVLQAHVLAMRHDLQPLRPVVAVLLATGHQAEIAGLPVGEDVEAAGVVVDAVLMAILAREEDPELPERLVRGQQPVLAGERALRIDDHVAVRAAAVHVAAVGLVALVVHLHIVGGIGAQHVAEHLVGAQGVVLDGVEHGAVVRPGAATRGPGNSVGQLLPRAQVQEAQLVDTAAHGVHAVAHQSVAGAHFKVGQIEVGMALGKLVLVQEVDLRGTFPVLAAHVHGVLLAFLEAVVVPVPVLAVGHAHIGLLDPSAHLGIEAVAQVLHRGQHGLGISILRVQVVDHALRVGIGRIGIALLLAEAHPEIRVGAVVAVQAQQVGFLVRTRGYGSFHGGRGPAGGQDQDEGECAHVRGDRRKYGRMNGPQCRTWCSTAGERNSPKPSTWKR